MPRDYEVYLEDIRDAIDKVKRYTTGLSRGTPVYVIRADRIVDLTKQDLAGHGKAIESRATRRPN